VSAPPAHFYLGVLTSPYTSDLAFPHSTSLPLELLPTPIQLFDLPTHGHFSPPHMLTYVPLDHNIQLDHVIAYALHQTRLGQLVTFAPLYSSL